MIDTGITITLLIFGVFLIIFLVGLIIPEALDKRKRKNKDIEKRIQYNLYIMCLHEARIFKYNSKLRYYQ